MRAVPAILVASQWLTTHANPVNTEPQSIDLLGWLESSDWSQPSVGQTMERNGNNNKDDSLLVSKVEKRANTDIESTLGEAKAKKGLHAW